MADELPDPKCLIVADADVLIRNALAEYLRNCGYKVFEAATADEAVSYTHLDVYKRQRKGGPKSKLPWRAPSSRG